ncbi:MAG: GlsB/YeaQ/YmgE family stress response membrane protein [Thermomicrobiales bacterium]
MDILAWIIFGALAGWIAGMLAGTGERQGCIASIVVGIAGAVIGGAGYKILTGEDWDFEFGVSSFLVAIGGAILLLFVLRVLSGGLD